MILTALFAPVFLWVHNLTSPKAPVTYNKDINEVTSSKYFPNKVVFPDVIAWMLEHKLLLTQCQVSSAPYITINNLL